MDDYCEEMAHPVARMSFGQASIVNITQSKAGPWLNKLTRQEFEAFCESFVKREDVRKDHPGLSETQEPVSILTMEWVPDRNQSSVSICQGRARG